VLEDFVLSMGTSVASAITAETIFEIVKCIADVDMLPRGRMGSKCEIFRFFNSGYAHEGAWGQNAKFSGFSILAMPTIEIFRFFRRRAFFRTGNTLIKPNYAVRQSRDSLHRDTHTMTKKSRRRRSLKPLELRS